MFALQNRAYDVQTVSWEKWNIFFEIGILLIGKMLWRRKTAWLCCDMNMSHFNISTYTYTHVRHFKLFVRVTKSTCICYKYLMSDSLGVAAATAAHRISGACASVYSLYFFKSTTFVHSTDVSVYSAIFCLFILCHCFESNAFVPAHPKFQIQLEYYMKTGKNFMALFLVHVITVFVEKFLPLFSFSMIFFSATHSKLLVQCFLLTLLLIKFASLKYIKHLIHIVTWVALQKKQQQ